MGTVYQLVASVFIAIVLYYILESFSTKKEEQDTRSTLSKWVTFGTIWLIAFVVVYYMNNMIGNSSGGSLEEQMSSINKNYEIQMIKNITENVRTGFPPF